MNGKLIWLLCFIVVINYLSVANGSKGTKRSLSRRSNDDDESEKVNDIVAVALNSQFKDKRYMLPVTPTQYKIATAWRGLKRFISKRALKVFSPGILRDAKIGKLLNTLMFENHINKQMKNVRPTRPIREKKDYDSSDEIIDENSEENSEEKPKRKKSRTATTGRKNLDDLL